MDLDYRIIYSQGLADWHLGLRVAQSINVTAEANHEHHASQFHRSISSEVGGENRVPLHIAPIIVDGVLPHSLTTTPARTARVVRNDSEPRDGRRFAHCRCHFALTASTNCEL